MNNLNIKETNVTKGAGQRLYKVWTTLGPSGDLPKPSDKKLEMTEEQKKAMYNAFNWYASKAKLNK